MGAYEVQPTLPLEVEIDPNQPELPFISELDILEKANFLFTTLTTIDANLSNEAGLTAEAREEIEASRKYYEEQLGSVLELGVEFGLFERVGAPEDDYEQVAA